ncbi:hypothetical protein G4L39_07810 [Limisphaera ngatamarikiensis]|uniref:DUF3106 domain-containing protein n=1 Tax=Limisphaera ngatamarikiensis TaxID=1324935 RepID=A0A6M1RNQ8_9BACT|nr:hypothetical protein [Limisphaera ngatamarikiensis]NGO39303.1 hypothetical protein [Limisphaera ngatamarikiensis]
METNPGSFLARLARPDYLWNRMNRRIRTWFCGAAALLAVWGLALTLYHGFDRQKVTADRIRQWMESTDLARLQGRDRAHALQQLADWINALPFEERRRLRLSGLWTNWFAAMTEAERAAFLDATLPTGMEQMLSAFEELPPDRRQRMLRDALRRLQEAATDLGNEVVAPPPGWSEELQRQVAVHGLRAFYARSSAQTKAELAPVLEEIQRLMQSGRWMRGGGQP